MKSKSWILFVAVLACVAALTVVNATESRTGILLGDVIRCERPLGVARRRAHCGNAGALADRA